jgi:hypothetical protein
VVVGEQLAGRAGAALNLYWLIGILAVACLSVLALLRGMRRLGLRTQFVILAAMGVSVGFLFLVMVQAPRFPEWFGVLLIAIVFFASTFGTRIFLRSLAVEDRRAEDEARAELPESRASGIQSPGARS